MGHGIALSLVEGEVRTNCAGSRDVLEGCITGEFNWAGNGIGGTECKRELCSRTTGEDAEEKSEAVCGLWGDIAISEALVSDVEKLGSGPGTNGPVGNRNWGSFGDVASL